MAAAVTASSAASSPGSSGSSVYGVSEEKTNGTRLARLLVDGGTHVLRKFLHSIHPSATLQHVLNNNSAKLQRLKLRRVIFDAQWEKLFPSSGDPSDSKTFDITLLHLLIREICHLTKPLTGWHTMPAEDDESLEAHITRIKCYRNELCHGISTGIPNDEFEEKWKQISSSLEALELYAYRKKTERLKNDPIDHDIQSRLEEQVKQWKEHDNELIRVEETEQESMNVPSCLPDELPGELMFGRLHQIQQVTEAIQSGTVSLVWITGGPGFGKTTVASKVAHELAKLDDRTVLFCSLRSKATFHDVTTSMSLACSKNQMQPPENPQHWLLNWSKQQVSNVTFVLDNADKVLEDVDCDEFMSLLEEMRKFSKSVTFMITSRKAFSCPNLLTKNVLLGSLPAEEARRVLLSRVPGLENRKNISKVEKLVELCCFVPLALCIAGSLLSDDYNEDELIQSLEQEPSDVLQVDRRPTDQTSVEKSIKSSFEVLDELEQKALVLLCVFPGSFNSDAAKSLITDVGSTNAKSFLILLELKARSLVEQLSPCRYQVHQLIQTFVQRIALDKYPGLLNRGKELACAHFMSRLADNANLYWGKDTCKQSVDSFNQDRHNFEHFLQILDQQIVGTSRTFLDDFPQKCMYLEKCVLPKFYMVILERLLSSFDSEMHPVHTVDVLCLLGHESRKEGDKKKYKELMEKAEQIHSKRSAEFETKPLSEVYFRNSYARFLSDKKDPNENKRMEHETETALKVCNDYLGDHPETAATLLFVGIYAKRRQERSEAEQKLTEALELFKTLLGKHLMTAQCLKAIADHCFVFDRKTEADLDHLDKCLAYYGDAMEVFEDLGMGDNKESVLTRKNFGRCHTRKGNFNEAMTLLTKADRVAEQELESDHSWKISIKTALAILHDKMRNLDQAKDVMREGLLMGKRLDLSIAEMRNKDEIREFINRYPETFPETAFPRNVRANTVPQADKTRHKGPKHVKPRIDAERPGSTGYGAWARSSSGGMGRVGPAVVAASEPDSRSSENRFSALAEENFSAPGRRQSYGFDGFGRSHQEPRKPVSDFGRRGPFRAGEQEKALEAIPAETLRKNIEFGLEQADSSSQHFARIQDELRTLILKKKARNKDVLKWIDENVSAADTKEASFIRALVTVVCEDTMDREESGQCKCHYGRLRDRKKLLQRYIGVNTDLELQALYAVQALFVQLDHPPGFIESYFDSFYDNKIVTKETFNAWESSSEEERGKGLAVTACSEFFRWIRSAAGED